ncbi:MULTISPECIES: TetR/AcrR family transcriptional regulator [Microbacterium]|uniref:TetR/AcrR family transcriptional regulator n=1 Tax=Microbacterium TaxID=33882 RepID=UPI002788C1E5|nr:MULTISPECIES: TetR/AcrR family transcriptional regulator [Microbacterium]MDQ1082611.1 AcrR family transcriptional regulator [Microbacterium sp. SORGH_AS_0344]MDQ1168617.1 AcrR family transcriptional regulator [Microbacterium proteolyticum]
MTSAPRAHPRPQQARSRQTEHRILAAAIRVLGEAGAEGLTTSSVSAAAGVSVGSLYRRFGDKQRLLLATQRELLREVEGRLVDSVVEMAPEVAEDPRATIRYMTIAMGRGFQLNPDALRAIMLVGLSDATVFEAGRHLSLRARRLFATSVLRHRDVIRHPDPVAAVDFAYRLVHSSCAHRLLEGEFLDSPAPDTWERMLDELSTVNVDYLVGRESEDRAGSRDLSV